MLSQMLVGIDERSGVVAADTRLAAILSPVPPDRVVIYVTTKDPQLAVNQRARIERYAVAMGWSVVQGPERDDFASLLAAAGAHAFDRGLCWRTSEIGHAEELLAGLTRYSVELLAVTQSCAALSE
jgi:hypothetical protein